MAFSNTTWTTASLPTSIWYKLGSVCFKMCYGTFSNSIQTHTIAATEFIKCTWLQGGGEVWPKHILIPLSSTTYMEKVSPTWRKCSPLRLSYNYIEDSLHKMSCIRECKHYSQGVSMISLYFCHMQYVTYMYEIWNPQALSSTLTALGTLQPKAFGF